MNSSASILISDNDTALRATLSKLLGEEKRTHEIALANSGISNISSLVDLASAANVIIFTTDIETKFENQRQARIAAMMGVRSFVLLIDDASGNDKTSAADMQSEFSEFVHSIATEENSLSADCFYISECKGDWLNHNPLAQHLIGWSAPDNKAGSSENSRLEVADQFETTIVWINENPMMSGRPYCLKNMSNSLDVSITALKYLIDLDSGEHLAAKDLQIGEIGVCNISLAQQIPFAPRNERREASHFTLYDKQNDELIGLGVIHFALRRASNVHWQELDVTRETRARMKGQKPAILWFTGLSGSGKSAIANRVEKKLTALGRHTYILDGDNIRHGLNRDLGFTDVARVENIRRIAEVSTLMADSGLIVLVSFISPFRSERQLARELATDGEFIEIHVNTPLEVAEARDVKGLYKKARAGQIENFTGIDSPYEAPLDPEIRVDTVSISADAAAENILEKLQSWGMIELH